MDFHYFLIEKEAYKNALQSTDNYTKSIAEKVFTDSDLCLMNRKWVIFWEFAEAGQSTLIDYSAGPDDMTPDQAILEIFLPMIPEEYKIEFGASLE